MRQAEGVGFEPTEHYCSRVFETRAFGRTMLPLLAKGNYSIAPSLGQTGGNLWRSRHLFGYQKVGQAEAPERGAL
jgi:hypothetical protein